MSHAAKDIVVAVALALLICGLLLAWALALILDSPLVGVGGTVVWMVAMAASAPTSRRDPWSTRRGE